jgi:vitamin B12 transporter
MMLKLYTISFITIAVTLLIFFNPIPSAFATSEDQQTLEMYFDEKDLVESVTRAPIDVSFVAENLTIVTAREIEAINAHTLADVLKNIPGMQINMEGGPGSGTVLSINGASLRQILVLIDGIQMNSLSDNMANVGAMPVQFIKRVEIIKGPASSSWGPALGGVVNVVTKDPYDDAKISGTLSSSLGERGTGDYRGELSGSMGDFGYYISGGKLTSSGLTPNTNVDNNYIYSKLRWYLPEKGSLNFSLGYDDDPHGDGQSKVLDVSLRSHTRILFSTLSMEYPLNKWIDLEVTGRIKDMDFNAHFDQLSTDEELDKTDAHETNYGASTKIILRQHRNSLVIGVDYDHGRFKSDKNAIFEAIFRRADRWGVFINDVTTFGKFAFTPAFRYDRTNYDGDFISASLGSTYKLTEHTILRAYVGKGYDIPSIIFNFAKEKVITWQAGFETSDLKYLLLKATYFRSYSTDAIDRTTEASEDQLKQGVEAELRTVPFYNTSLFAGFNFVDARNRETDDEIPGIARYTWNLGINYDDMRSFRGNLTGHYIWWNNISDSNSNLPGHYTSFIWDLNLNKKIYSKNDISADIFFTAHNIFNGSQYQDGLWPNPRRWFEGGVRFRF